MTQKKVERLLEEIRGCTHCMPHLPLGPRPLLTAGAHSRVLIVGQAPGRRVHESGTPWDDQSGDRLRDWLGISREQFYDPGCIALVPMGFCYPGTGRSGDLPPRKECAELWHERMLALLGEVKLTLLIGKYAQAHYLPEYRKTSLTETVRSWKKLRPARIPLPHPSPRNNIWLRRNPWFEAELVPYLKRRVRGVLRA